MQNFRLFYKPFPPEYHGIIKGATGGKPGGRLTILIDSLLSAAEQKKTLKHELAHIALGHFSDTEERGVTELEAEADAKAESMTEEELETLLKWAI